MNDIGKRISALLSYRGMTQRQLAEKAGVTEAAISRYIKGDRVPRAVTIAALANALDVAPSELLGEGACGEEDLDYAVRLVARNASSLTEAQKMEIFSALAKL